MKLLFFITLCFFIKANASIMHDPACMELKNSQLKLKAHTDNISYSTRSGGKYLKKVIICKSNKCHVVKSNVKKIVYEPGHPHSNKRGYVVYPDIDVREEYSLVSRAVRDLKELASDGACNLKVANLDIGYVVKYKTGSILKDIFKFNKDHQLITWTRLSRGGKQETIDYVSRLESRSMATTSLVAF